MANSAAANKQIPIGPRWKKWMKTSDPVPYKGCIIFLFTLCQLYCLGLGHCWKKIANGRVCMWGLVRKRKSQEAAVSKKRSEVLVTLFLIQVIIPLYEVILFSHGQWKKRITVWVCLLVYTSFVLTHTHVHTNTGQNGLSCICRFHRGIVVYCWLFTMRNL